MELRGFSDEHGVQVASWALDAKEVALLSGRVEYPFPEDLLTSWRTVEEDIHSYLLFDGGFAADLIELGRRDAAKKEDELAALFDLDKITVGAGS